MLFEFQTWSIYDAYMRHKSGDWLPESRLSTFAYFTSYLSQIYTTTSPIHTYLLTGFTAMNDAGSDRLSLPGLKVSQDLKLVSGALQDFQDKMQKRAESGMLQPYSPGIPPAVFGAGGPM